MSELSDAVKMVIGKFTNSLMHSPQNESETPLVIASKMGDIEMVKQFINAGVTIADCKAALVAVTALEPTFELHEIVEVLYDEQYRLIQQEWPTEERLTEQEEITLPTPPPISNIEIESTISNIERKMIELQKEGLKHERGVRYEPNWRIADLMYLHLLEKYSNNCAIVRLDIHLDTERIYVMDPSHEDVADDLSKKILDCIRRGSKIIVIPVSYIISPTLSHANVLVIRPLLRTAERFEPNGSRGYTYGTEEQVNRLIKNLVENQMQSKIGTYKYIPPQNMCYHGFQYLESRYPGFDNIEGEGFCSMWSIFLMELVLMNPEYTTTQIIEEGLKISKSEPKYLKEVIRGYVKDVEKTMDNIFQYGFKFGKSKSEEIYRRMGFNRRSSIDYFDTRISRINSRVFESKPQPETPIYELKDAAMIHAKKIAKEQYSFGFLNLAGIVLLSYLFTPDSSSLYRNYMDMLQNFVFSYTVVSYILLPELFTAELNEIFDDDEDQLDGGGSKDDILLENIGIIEMFVGKKISNGEKEKLKEWYESPGSKIVVYENNRKIINISSFDFIKILATKMKPFIEEMQMEQMQQSKMKQPAKMEEEEEVQIEEIDGGKKKTQKKLRKKSRRKPRKKSRKHK